MLAEEHQDFQVRAQVQVQEGPVLALAPRLLARREEALARPDWWELPVRLQREEQA